MMTDALNKMALGRSKIVNGGEGLNQGLAVWDLPIQKPEA
jgi:hypothetical protein